MASATSRVRSRSARTSARRKRSRSFVPRGSGSRSKSVRCAVAARCYRFR
jgi:hypothetical protein